MVREFVIDLFCGAGGTSEGVHLANCDSQVVFCVNHDAKAIHFSCCCSIVKRTEMNKEKWIDVKEQKPDYEKKVFVKLDNGEETIGFINDNYQRTCWLIKGTGGMFWRSMVNTVTHWKAISE